MEAPVWHSLMSAGLESTKLPLIISSSPSVTSDLAGVMTPPGCCVWCVVWLLLVVVTVTEARNIIRCSVEEEVAMGTVVVNVLDEARLRQELSATPDILHRLKFGFLTNSQWNFFIDERSGLMTTNGRIDRESITGCAGKDICEVTLDVAVQPVEYLRIIKVIIEILDINDNSPMFPETELTHPILESAIKGNSFVIPTAMDLDSSLYGVTRYELETDDDTFGISQKEKLDGAFDLRLTVQKPLDRELRHQYRVKITAFDGGNPSKHGSMRIVIPVMDSNDNSPLFDNDTYRVTVPENVATGVTIIRVHATDNDVGQNGRIQYGFSPMTQGLYGSMLTINEETGDIFVVGELDREKVDVCNLIVTATDMGPDSLPSDTTVIVTVTDINDNAPHITINTLGSPQPNKAYISEDVLLGTFVAHVSVTDPDKGLAGELNCSLNDYSFNLVDAFDTEYKIITARTLDRETIPQYGLEIVCRDKGSPPQVSIKRVTVIIKDVNDNPPVFSKSSYISSIEENDFVGLGIVQAIATDRDVGPNGKVAYSLIGETSDAFEIDSETGAIKTRIALDREKVPKYLFQVVASDHGEPPKSATAHIVITVDDLNDEIPQFNQKKFTFHIQEHLADRSPVGKVYAVDRDAPPHNAFMYSFTGDSSTLPFSIDTMTGNIVTRKPLDRELSPVYHLVVRASDQGHPPKSSTTSVTIFVTDKNDHEPVFEFPNKRNNTVLISNQVPVGSAVTRVHAHDPDADNNARIAYRIMRGNDESVFSMHPDNGTITVNIPLRNKDYAQYKLRVEARDHGIPAFRTETDLRIIVNSSIPYGQSALRGASFHYNVIVVVAVACGGAVITVSLIVGILLVRSQGRKRRVHKYNCRMEAKRMLTAKELQSSAPEESIPMKNGPQLEGSGGLEISKSLSAMEHHPCISGITPETPPVIQLHPKPWTTSASSSTPAIQLRGRAEDRTRPGMDHRSLDHRGGDHRSLDHQRGDHRSLDHRGNGDHRNLEHRGNGDHRSLDHRGADHRNLDHRGAGDHRSLDHRADQQDRGSDHSGDGSQTDSGRGASEEGEGKNRAALHHLGHHYGGHHHGAGHYGTHGHVKLPSGRRDLAHNTLPGSSTMPIRPSPNSGAAYPPPPPPPSRMRTFSPEGRVGQSTDSLPSSVVYPTGMDTYAQPSKPDTATRQSNNTPHRTSPGKVGSHGNIVDRSGLGSSSTSTTGNPWEQNSPKRPVIGESVIV